MGYFFGAGKKKIVIGIMQAIEVLSKGQITLPKKIRKGLNIKEGDTLIIEKTKGEITLKEGKTIYNYIGTLPKPDIPIEEMIY